MNILLFNQYAGNKGDRAVLFATCMMIRDIYADADVTVSTSSPELYDGYSYYKEENIHFIPAAWDYERVKGCTLYWRFLRKVRKYTFTILREAYLRNCCKWFTRFFINPQFYKTVKKADCIISVGGHHYCTLLSRDLVSGINFDAMAVKLSGKKFTCFSQTFGPFDFHNPRNEQVTRKILSDCELYPREEESQKKLLDFGIPKDRIHMTKETVLALNGLFKEYNKSSVRDRKVGVAIYCTQKRGHDAEEAYVASMASLCSHIIEKGYKVQFFPMELKASGPDDRPFIDRIIERVIGKENCSVVDADLESADHLQAVCKCQAFVGHKTHSVIFALATGTPLLAIAYHPKTIEFMKQFGMERFAIDDAHVSSESLCKAFDELVIVADAVGAQEFEGSRQFAKEIHNLLLKVLG